jgi:hypothetical protein
LQPWISMLSKSIRMMIDLLCIFVLLKIIKSPYK